MVWQPIELSLGGRSYTIDVTAGGLEGLGAAIAAVERPGRIAVVTNPTVAALHLAAALASLEVAGFESRVVLVPDGEQHKHVGTWADLMDALLDAGVDRQTPIAALGGGVVGDLAGFAAATALRGVPFVQVPTTLLAMVDASVGGKTGFNTRHGKNLVGAFYQPRLVHAATGVLATLPDAEWRCGLGEALKHGVILDSALAEWMGREHRRLAARDPETAARLVHRCCEIKAQVVSSDEREAGRRALLNFGHTVGHALETALGHGTMRHGEAVALGMLIETRHAIERGWCLDRGLAERLRELVEALGLPTRLPAEVARDGRRAFRAAIDAAVRMDKKNARGRLTLVAPVSLGEARLVSIPAEDIEPLLALTESWEMP